MKKILFVAANPVDTGRLALDEEMRSIAQRTENSPFAAQLKFVAAWAARPDDLLQEINRHTPTVLHFSGHGTNRGIQLVGWNKQAVTVSDEAIMRLLDLRAAKTIKVVVLNSCYSSSLAEKITEDRHRCAVGTIEEWGDEQAALFSASFYRALGFGCTLDEAVKQGATSIVLEGHTGADDVRLLGTDSVKQMRLVGGASGSRVSRVRGMRDGTPAGEESVPLLNESECAAFVSRVLSGAESASLTYIDVDGLLGINHVYGEHVGDLVLQKCGEMIAKHASPAAALCRLRGDQYVVVDRDTPYETAEQRATKLVARIRRHNWSRVAPDLHVSATGSIAHWDEGEDAPTLLLRAVLGVKAAKISHRATLSAAPLALPELGGELERDRLSLLSGHLSSDTRSYIRSEAEKRVEEWRRQRPRF